ncbi:iron ABC transporter permease [Comamonas sp. w2-DMI]|uniref:FecCD family ABC transporter permease n=1 Tax=Comamonas sp. w2-DMI TaxID=3126391 RepID=UPI0032E4CAB2
MMHSQSVTSTQSGSFTLPMAGIAPRVASIHSIQQVGSAQVSDDAVTNRSDFSSDKTLVWITCGLNALLIVLMSLSLFVGYVDMSPLQLAQGALAGDFVPQRILLDIRLPRTLLCAAVGATLGLTGAAMQGLLRNPLAEPGLLGVSSGAALGAVLALYTGFANAFYLALPLSGFTGTALACAFVFALAGSTTHRTTLILGGVAVSSLCGALISLVLNWSANPLAMSEIVFWMMGSLADRSIQDLLLALPFMVLGCGVLLSCGTALRALSLGEETAHSMGMNLGGIAHQDFAWKCAGRRRVGIGVWQHRLHRIGRTASDAPIRAR